MNILNIITIELRHMNDAKFHINFTEYKVTFLTVPLFPLPVPEETLTPNVPN